ncbi:hypothetical protein B0F89_1582 [Malaciobacter marinus]|uniref:Uncharacterized protein n=1 Tax=Malaciobacter marinus TaxID=505249 RepID=A0AB36ZUA7_9BACT|nr:hypothetical protein [Malaciobacter marinus]PPK57009.1 hypothetical protein B0F89_1582 [Malaciobacter marinus]
MKKTQDVIDKEVLEEVFTTKGLIEKDELQKKVCNGNSTNEKYFRKIYSVLLEIGIIDINDKLNEDYRNILKFKKKKKSEIVLEITPHIQRLYKDYKKATTRATNSLKQEYSEYEDSKDYKIGRKEIYEEREKLYGEHIYLLANHVRESLYALINNKEPEPIKKNHVVSTDPLEDENSQLVNRLAFKNVVNIILKNGLKEIDDKSILDIVRHWYYQDADIDANIGIGDARRNYRENDIDRELKKLYEDESEKNLIIAKKIQSIPKYVLLKVFAYEKTKKNNFDYKYLGLLKKFDTVVSDEDSEPDIKLKKFTNDDIDILKEFQLIYMNEETKEYELLTEKKVQDTHVNNIKKDIVTALKLIGIIKRNFTPTCYKLKVPKDPYYRLGADTKVETINTLIDKLCEVSEKDISPETKAQILKIFDFTVPKNNLKKRIVLRKNLKLYFKFSTSSFHK